MRIIAYSTLREFWTRPGRQDAAQPLRTWFAIAERAEWSGPADIKRQFGSASFVGDRVVFNIAGNKYRLVVYPNYQWHTVYIRFIGAHADYDQIDVENV